jgi:hypothetical protein
VAQPPSLAHFGQPTRAPPSPLFLPPQPTRANPPSWACARCGPARQPRSAQRLGGPASAASPPPRARARQPSQPSRAACQRQGARPSPARSVPCAQAQLLARVEAAAAACCVRSVVCASPACVGMRAHVRTTAQGRFRARGRLFSWARTPGSQAATVRLPQPPVRTSRGAIAHVVSKTNQSRTRRPVSSP